MNEVIADTSVWIDFLNGINNKQTLSLSEILQNDTELFICPQIIQEILQGISKDDDYRILKEKLLSLNILILDPIETAIGAAEIFRGLRKKGVTIRRSNDLVIAYYGIYYNIPLLHKDRDFDKIAKNTKLRTFI